MRTVLAKVMCFHKTLVTGLIYFVIQFDKHWTLTSALCCLSSVATVTLSAHSWSPTAMGLCHHCKAVWFWRSGELWLYVQFYPYRLLGRRGLHISQKQLYTWCGGDGGGAHNGRLSRMEITHQPALSLQAWVSCPLGLACCHLPRGCSDGGAGLHLSSYSSQPLACVERIHQPQPPQHPSSLQCFSSSLHKQRIIRQMVWMTQGVTGLGGGGCLYVKAYVWGTLQGKTLN